MSAAAAGRAPIMPLSDLVRLYRSHAGKFGEPVALSAFGLANTETERLFSGFLRSRQREILDQRNPRHSRLPRRRNRNDSLRLHPSVPAIIFI